MRLESWFTREPEDHFARPVDRVEDLRPDLQAALASALQPGEPIRYMINAPYQGVLKRRKERRGRFGFLLPWQLTPDWLLVLTPARLLLVSVPGAGAQPRVNSIPLANLLYLHSGVILLFSWFEVDWVEDGAVRQETVYYNAVCERFFDRLSMLIRGDVSPRPSVPPPDLPSNREILESLPYKFSNLIPMRLLLPGERILCAALRQAQYTRPLGIFRRMVSPRLVMALTDRHLLLAEEDLSVTEGSYGFISTFLPLGHICRAAVAHKERQLELTVSLELQGAEKQVTVAFPAELGASVREIAQRLEMG